MTTLQEILDAAQSLPVEQRLELIYALQDTIIEDGQQRKLTDAEKAELDRRLDAYEKSADRGTPWETVKARLLDDG